MYWPRRHARYRRPGIASVKGRLKSEVNSYGRLCEVGNFVGIQTRKLQVWCLVHQTAILGPKTKVAVDSEFDSTAIDECGFSLAINAEVVAPGIIGWVENQRSCAREDIGCDVTNMRWNVCDECSGYLKKIRAY